MAERREVWLKVRTTQTERARWRAKAEAAGLSLSALVRRALVRTQTWTVANTDVARRRNRELARIGVNLNQIARWANTHKSAAEAVEVIAHLAALARDVRAAVGQDPDAH